MSTDTCMRGWTKMYDRLRREVSYVQGLMESGNQNNHPEGKAIQRLLDIVDELLEANEHLELRFLELEEYVESIDEDLNELELLVYEDEEDDDDDEDEGELCIVCPECGQDVYVDYEDVENSEIELLCPECHTVLIVEDASDTEPETSGIDEDDIE